MPARSVRQTGSRAGQLRIVHGLFSFTVALVLAGCQWGASAPRVSHTIPASVQAPHTISRLVVLYPATSVRDLRDAYSRLEADAFTLKSQRPWMRIVDRRHLPAIVREQQFQLRGMVSEDTAVHLGRMLGVDAALVYQIEGPSLRDIVLARFSGDVSPIVITSKIILVETAEVVFHNVVTSPIPPSPDSLASDVRGALERAVVRTSSDLQYAFQ
jgi:hypothetical protein